MIDTDFLCAHDNDLTQMEMQAAMTRAPDWFGPLRGPLACK